MPTTIDPARRTAVAPDSVRPGPVTLINCFVVAEGREEAFANLWAGTSRYFRAQPGFISLRLHRALSPGASYRFINVAEWASAAQFGEAHAAAEFKSLISQQQWQEFPSSPALYEVNTEYRATAA
jgi:heme-degrading monooxygenase HmoA